MHIFIINIHILKKSYILILNFVYKKKIKNSIYNIKYKWKKTIYLRLNKKNKENYIWFYFSFFVFL